LFRNLALNIFEITETKNKAGDVARPNTAI